MPSLAEIWQLYLRRFAIERWYRECQTNLALDGSPKLSTPEQCQRWSDLMPLVTWQLWLAKDKRERNSSTAGISLSLS